MLCVVQIKYWEFRYKHEVREVSEKQFMKCAICDLITLCYRFFSPYVNYTCDQFIYFFLLSI